MEPVSLAAIVLTAVVTKAVDSLGDGVVAAAGRLRALAGGRSPEIAKQLAAGENSADPNVIDVEILKEELRAVAAKDPEVQAVVEEIAAAVSVDQSSFQSLTKIADSVGNVFLGKVERPVFNQTFKKTV